MKKEVPKAKESEGGSKEQEPQPKPELSHYTVTLENVAELNAVIFSIVHNHHLRKAIVSVLNESLKPVMK